MISAQKMWPQLKKAYDESRMPVSFLVFFQQFFLFESFIILIAIEVSHVGNIKILIIFEMFFLGIVVQFF